MNVGRDFTVAAVLEPTQTDARTVEKATRVLEQMQVQGSLPPIQDWEGPILEGWKDLLGLNGRPIRSSVKIR